MMKSDLRYILTLLAFCLIPLCIFGVLGVSNENEERWSYDAHLQHFEKAIVKPENPSIVFFGTSRTMNNINTYLINEKYSDDSNKKLSYNLGVNWFGHDLQFHMIRRWLEFKQPKAIVLEIPMLYRYKSHPNFTKVAEPIDIGPSLGVAPFRFLESSLMQLPTWCYRKLAELLRFEKQNDDYEREKLDGFLKIDLTTNQSLELAQKMSKKLELGQVHLQSEKAMKKVYHQIRYAYHFEYLKKIVELCQTKDVILIPLVLPKLRVNQVHPDLMNRYEMLFKPLIPPAELIQKPQYWRDESHMTEQGAEITSLWLINKIKENFASTLE